MNNSTASNKPAYCDHILVIDSVSRACSVALIEGGAVIASDYQEIGRGHAERLVPMLAALPNKGRSPRIAVNCGPGSFTGVRIGLSVARALAFAWDAKLIGYKNLSIVAAAALAKSPAAERLSVIMNGGHGEFLTGLFGANGEILEATASLPRDQLQRYLDQPYVAGDAFNALAVENYEGTEIVQYPDARAFPLLSEHGLCVPEALYARPPDAVAKTGRKPVAPDRRSFDGRTQ